MLTPQVPIAKEGVPFIGFAAFSTLVFAVLGFTTLTIFSLLITLFIVMFFRDPERFIPEENYALVSPADGKVILIEKIFDDRYLQKDVFKVSIFMNVFNVHVNRIPFSGKVERVIHEPGKFYSADSTRGALQNENCATILTTKQDETIAFVQVAGLIARRIVCWLEQGDAVTLGSRYGLIRFGSRVDLYLPISTNITVEEGQKVRAGETILGHLQS